MIAMTAEDIKGRLGLERHPTCGYVAETYRSTQRVASGGLPEPFGGGRPLGSALTFLVTPDAPVQLHRIRNDQLYHFYLGDPLEVLLFHEDGSYSEAVVGPDMAAGHLLFLPIRGGTFHTARLAPGGSWFLGASTEWPGVEPADVELGEVDALATLFPAAADRLRSFLSESPG